MPATCARCCATIEEEDYIDLNKVALMHYRLSKLRQQDLVMEKGFDYGLKPGNDLGSGRAKDKEEFLPQIIARLNRIFMTDGLSDADLTNYAQTIRDKVRETKLAMLGGHQAVDDAVMDSSEAHKNQMMQYLSNPEVARSFARVVFDLISAIE